MRRIDNSEANGAGALRRIWRRVTRPLFADPAARFSDAVDQAMLEPGSTKDPVVDAILRSTPSAPMPPDLQQRSWNAIERDLFQAPAVYPPLAIPFRDRGRPTGHTLLRIPRIVVAGVAAFAMAAAYGAWRGPVIVGKSLVHQSTRQWSRIRSFDGDVQFVSLIPGKQMQWSGRQIYGGPGQMFLQVDLMGVPLRMVVHGAKAAADVSTIGANSETLYRLRFIAWALDPGLPERLLRHAPNVRYVGRDRVLDQPCQVIDFSLGEARDAGPLPGIPRSVVSGRVWLSMDRRLPSQLELYGSDGAAALSYRYSNIRYNVAVRRHLFDVPFNRRARPITLRVVKFRPAE